MLIRTEIATDQLLIEDFIQRCTGKTSVLETLRRLREEGALALSLLALDDAGQIQGYIAFSTVYNPQQDCGWLWLFPLIIAPQYKTGTLSQQLRQEGLESLYGFGYAAVMTISLRDRPSDIEGFKLAEGAQLVGLAQARITVYPLRQLDAARGQQQVQLALPLTQIDLANLSDQ